MPPIRGRVPAGSKAPFCADCGSSEAHAVQQDDGNIWLCGSCEILRANPDAPRATHPPGLPSTWRKTGKPQNESLL